MMNHRPRMHPITRLAHRAGDVALSTAAVIGTCCLLITLAGLLIDVRPLIFRSGSMAPAIPAGSLAVAREVPGTAVRIGDVVSVPYRESRVTHRVVEISAGSGDTELWLKGDANDHRDPQSYRAQTVDRVLFSVPVLGRVVAWLSRPPGIFLLAGYAAVLFAVLFRRRRTPPQDPTGSGPFPDGRHRPEPARTARGPAPPLAASASRVVHHCRLRAASGALLLGGTGSLVAAPSWATFTDTAPVSGTSISTRTIPAPTLSCGSIGVLSVTLRWTIVPQATSYTLHFGTNGSETLTTTSRTYTDTAIASLNGRAWVTANRNFGATTWTSANSNQANYLVAVVGACST